MILNALKAHPYIPKIVAHWILFNGGWYTDNFNDLGGNINGDPLFVILKLMILH